MRSLEKGHPLALDWLRKNDAFVMAILVLLASGAILSVFASRFPHFPGDIYAEGIVKSIQLPFFDPLMRLVTALGYLPAALGTAGIAAIAFWRFGHRLEAAFIILSLSDEFVSAAVKMLVRRPRPTPDVWDSFPVGGGNSFPSGHVVHFVVFYGFLIYLANTEIERRWLRMAIVLVASALVLLVGVSRVYLGAHWPSDVLGGYVFGALWLLLLIRAYLVARGRFST